MIDTVWSRNKPEGTHDGINTNTYMKCSSDMSLVKSGSVLQHFPDSFIQIIIKVIIQIQNTFVIVNIST